MELLRGYQIFLKETNNLLARKIMHVAPKSLEHEEMRTYLHHYFV